MPEINETVNKDGQELRVIGLQHPLPFVGGSSSVLCIDTRDEKPKIMQFGVKQLERRR